MVAEQEQGRRRAAARKQFEPGGGRVGQERENARVRSGARQERAGAEHITIISNTTNSYRNLPNGKHAFVL